MLRLLPFDGAIRHFYAADAPDARRRARLVAAFGFLGFVGGTTLALTHLLFFGIPPVHVLAPLAAGLTSFVAPLVLLEKRSLALGGHVIAACWLIATGWGVFLRGGLASPPVMTLAAVPFIAMGIVGSRAGLAWIGVCLAEVTTYALLQACHVTVPDRMPREFQASSNVLVAVLFGSLLLLMAVAQEWLRVKAQEELAVAERSKGEAEREAQILRADRLASLGQLAASLAHEINNPLSYVMANLEFLEGCVSGEDPRAALHDAVDGASRVKTIVQDLKTFARGDDAIVTRADLRDVVAASTRMVAGEVKTRAILTTVLGECPKVLASEIRLGQIVVNLLVNAAQAIPEGNVLGNAIDVTVGTDDAGAAFVSVRDTGQGIPAALLKRVREPFFTTKPVGVGTGLGLSVCDDLVRRFGGTMAILSTVGKGTTVTVTLPAAGRHIELSHPPAASPHRAIAG